MAARARLTAPREVRTSWPWHQLNSSSLRASLLFSGQRRMEAENFLASAFGVRLLIQSKSQGWTHLHEVAHTWQPSRLKGIQVSPEFGTPFLAATQVFDVRPVPRKWLSLNRTADYAQRYITEGTIVVTCSGSVGRATLINEATENVLISHDLLRVEARQPERWGWLYAYLRAPTVRAMMEASQYGHIIKHLETHHLDQLPIIEPEQVETYDRCSIAAREIIGHRNSALRKMLEAEELFEAQFPASGTNVDEAAFSVKAGSNLFGGRRRFDASNHNPEARAIELRLRQTSKAWLLLSETRSDVWLPNRFRRIPAADGVELVDSSQIFEVNPDSRRCISRSGVQDKNDGFVEPGWLMMSRSGQVYGLLGSVAMATGQHAGKLISDDVIRIAPGDDIASGYLYMALSHHKLGRPRVKALAYGSSIPHIEPEDLKSLPLPRLDVALEEQIAGLVEDAFLDWSRADELEDDLAQEAERALSDFLIHKG